MSKYLFVSLCYLCLSTGNHHVSRRALLFPRSTFLQFTYGLSVPLVLPRRSINISLCAQNNYNLPYNASLLQPKIIPARKQTGFLTIRRRMFYKYAVRYLDSFGLEGEECLLRSICEIAETPMHIKDENTLLEKLVHFVFTPSLEMYSATVNLTKADSMSFVDKLLMAERIGKDGGRCSEEYSECLVSLVDIFSAKYII
ncbi:hypothetical protein NQ315_000305 [Exocentrus adspersus]|uniref:Uncharacterized protein n=1 Tax=Exocentrus adspersus TaxID=1586481 RepID=A0AAV8VRG9_9CUCU|nr:hypothetical protein NQ315_000305 [Exocentrus adspersus]